MNKLSKAARTLVVEKMNKAIKDCPLPEARQVLINSFSFLLIDLKSYKGFSYDYWIQTGYKEWVAAGKPESTKPYLGDETKITFF